MSCTDPILSFGAMIARAARYANGCGVMAVTEESEGDAMVCAQAGTPSLVLLAMAFDEGASTFRVVTTNVSIDDVCDGYDLSMVCNGETAEQAFRRAITIEDEVATIRVLFINDTTEACQDCSSAELPTSAMIGATVVTDGTDTYILAIAPDDEVTDTVDCTTIEEGSETFTRAALTSATGCGMWAWRVSYGELSGGDFSDDFSDDFFT